MRWEELFEDLEMQAAAISATELEAEVAERVRIEDSRITWVRRLRASVGREIDVDMRSIGRLRGVVTRVGSDFLLLTSADRASLVPFAAVVSITGLGPAADATAHETASALLGLSSALRALAVDRAAVAIHCADGQRHIGTPARVGADYVEVFLSLEDDRLRHSTASSRRVVIPFSGLVLVRRVEA